MDPDAEELLVHAAEVRQLARRLLRDPHAAQDAEQATWLAAFEHGPAPGRPAGPWLARTLRNFAWRGLREGARRRRREELAARAEAAPSAAELCERAELHRELVEAVVGLEEPFRSAILLRYFEGLPAREIARRLDVPVRTVQSRLARGLERLRARLERRHAGHGAWLFAWTGLRRPAAAPVAVAGVGVAIVSTKLKVGVAVALVVALAAIRVAWRSGESAKPGGSAAVAVSDDLLSVGEERELESSVDAEDAKRRAVRPSLANEAAAPLVEDTTLRGLVIDARGAPIAGALVEAIVYPLAGTFGMRVDLSLSPRVLAHATTGEDGRFGLELESQRPVDLRASAEGFSQEFARGRRAGQEATLVLEDPGVLFGRVRRAGGDPVAGALVWVQHGDGRELESRARTDAAGDWRMGGLAPGLVGLTVVPENLASTRYEELLLEPGQARRHDVEVVAGMTIHGRVRDAVTGAPIEGAEVSAWSFLYKNVLTDTFGAYRIEGVATRFMPTVCARAPGYGQSEKLAGAVEGTAEVDLELAPGFRAIGRVIGPAGEPVVGAYVAATALREETGLDRRDWIAARTGADGTFELEPLRRDLRNTRHTLVVRAEGLSMRRCEFPEAESIGEVVDFGALVLTPQASLAGVVVRRDGEPVPGAGVMVEPSHADRPGASWRLRDMRLVRTDDRGRFLHADLAGGTYRLSVNPMGFQRNPEDLQIDLKAGEHRDGLRIEMPDGLTISGRVIGPTGEPFSGVRVSLNGGPGAGTATAADGSFVFRGVAPGTYWISVEPPRARPEGAPRLGWGILEDVRAGSSDMEIVLPLLGEVTGWVVDGNGEPVEHALVDVLDEHSDIEKVFTGPDGAFRLEVPQDAAFDLRARRTTLKVGAWLDRAPLEPAAIARGVAAGSTGVVLRLP